jgi:hypothetical protein
MDCVEGTQARAYGAFKLITAEVVFGDGLRVHDGYERIASSQRGIKPERDAETIRELASRERAIKV